MSAEIILHTFTILIFSLIIARISRIVNPLDDLKGFLFEGNNRILSVTSNAGSFLSIAIIFTLYIVGFAGGGFLLIASIFLGLLCGYIFLYLGLRYLIHRHYDDLARFKHTTFCDFIDDDQRTKYSIVFIIQYMIALNIEFATIIYFFKTVFPISSPALIFIISILGLLCATYVSVGGYSGVLRTDFFQLTIFIIGFLLIFIKAWPQSGELVANNLSFKNIEPVNIFPLITFIIFSAANFSSFPDVWVRNISTLNFPNKNAIKYLIASFAFLVFLMIPITIIGFLQIDSLDSFSQTFDVPRTLQFYTSAFINSKLIVSNHLVMWFLVASFLCVFITTVDTWLIGIMQHTYRHIKRNELVLLMPFATIILTLSFAFFMNQEKRLIVGLFLFPILFCSTFTFVLIISPHYKNEVGFNTLFLYFLLSEASTLGLILLWNQKLEEMAYAIILIPAGLLFLLFFVTPAIRSKLNRG